MYEELRGDLAAWATHFHFNDETSLLLCKAADAIEDLSKTLEAEVEINTALECNMPVWIPVTERLPENTGNYFVYVQDGQYPNIHYYALANFYHGSFHWEQIQNKVKDVVSHWMPLPEPPKADKDGEE